MALFSYNRFRLIVLFLVILIVWKIIYLLQSKTDEKTASKLTDVIEELENEMYNKHRIDRVRVKVYYEALCPDSRHFFMHSLKPVSESLGEFLNITLIPYGKATTTENDGRYTFACQHGEKECYANKIHACAIDKLREPGQRVSLTTCMISDNADPDAALRTCGSKENVETKEILKCANSERGSILLKEYGEATHAIAITFIPTITLNDSLDHQALILKKFLLAVCQEIAMPLPPPCL